MPIPQNQDPNLNQNQNQDSIIAKTADGVEHRFPAGTPRGVIDTAIKNYIASKKTATPKAGIVYKYPKPLDPNSERTKQLEREGASDLGMVLGTIGSFGAAPALGVTGTLGKAALSSLLAGAGTAGGFLGGQEVTGEKPDYKEAAKLGAETAALAGVTDLGAQAVGSLLKYYLQPKWLDEIFRAAPSESVSYRGDLQAAKDDLIKIAKQANFNWDTLKGGTLNPDMRPRAILEETRKYLRNMYQTERAGQAMVADRLGSQIHNVNLDPRDVQQAAGSLMKEMGFSDPARAIAEKLAKDPKAALSAQETDSLIKELNTRTPKLRDTKPGTALAKTKSLYENLSDELTNGLEAVYQGHGLPGIKAHLRRYAALSSFAESLEDITNKVERERFNATLKPYLGSTGPRGYIRGGIGSSGKGKLLQNAFEELAKLEPRPNAFSKPAGSPLAPGGGAITPAGGGPPQGGGSGAPGGLQPPGLPPAGASPLPGANQPRLPAAPLQLKEASSEVPKAEPKVGAKQAVIEGQAIKDKDWLEGERTHEIKRLKEIIRSGKLNEEEKEVAASQLKEHLEATKEEPKARKVAEGEASKRTKAAERQAKSRAKAKAEQPTAPKRNGAPMVSQDAYNPTSIVELEEAAAVHDPKGVVRSALKKMLKAGKLTDEEYGHALREFIDQNQVAKIK